MAEALDFHEKADGTFWMEFHMWADLFTSLTICSTAQAVAKSTELGHGVGQSGGRRGAVSRVRGGRSRKRTIFYGSIPIDDVTVDSDEAVPLGYQEEDEDVQISTSTR